MAVETSARQPTAHITDFSAGTSLRCGIRVASELLFDLDAELLVYPPDGDRQQYFMGATGMDISWLPEGRYLLDCLSNGDWAVGSRLELILRVRSSEGMIELDRSECQMRQPIASSPHWRLSAAPGEPSLQRLSWVRGAGDWFYRHFDHAARTVAYFLMKDHPLLRGEILDVGCGDGITDLGIALRKQPKRLVGVDPFRGYERLPEIIAKQGLPASALRQSGLEFRPDSGNSLGFEDNSFDVVLSWGSLEHIAGGHEQTLSEIRRVLRPGGLFFAHPGLFYGSTGNHLNEFFDDPWIHLKLDRETLKQRVLAGKPAYIDRAGDDNPPEKYWQWYEELNPITVEGFEKQMRALDFEPWRFALRTDPVVEYSEELQPYSMTTLGISELYSVFVSRKA